MRTHPQSVPIPTHTGKIAASPWHVIGPQIVRISSNCSCKTCNGSLSGSQANQFPTWVINLSGDCQSLGENAPLDPSGHKRKKGKRPSGPISSGKERGLLRKRVRQSFDGWFVECRFHLLNYVSSLTRDDRKKGFSGLPFTFSLPSRSVIDAWWGNECKLRFWEEDIGDHLAKERDDGWGIDSWVMFEISRLVYWMDLSNDVADSERLFKLGDSFKH